MSGVGCDPQNLLSELGNPAAIHVAKRWMRVLPKQGADVGRPFVMSHDGDQSENQLWG